METQTLKSKVTDPSTTEKLLEIEIPRENFNSVYNEKVKKYSKELRLNGYRKGTIPKRIISERFKEPITNETLEKLVDDVIREVCKEQNISPVAPGKVEELKNEGENPIFLKALIEVDPEVEISDYKDLGVVYEKPSVTEDKEIEDQINSYAESIATESDKEGKSEEGDIAVGSYLSIKIDGEEKELPEDKSFRVSIGKDKIPEFNKAFLAVSAGDEKSISVKYAKDYENPDLAGKKGEYQVKIESIKTKDIPVVDDEFAKKLGTQTLDELKARIRENLEETKERDALKKAETEVMEAILAKHPFDVPKARIKHYVEYQIHGGNYNPDENHDHSHDIPPEQMKFLEDKALYELRKHRILEVVSKKENIKAVQTEVDARIESLAKQNGLEFETLKASLRKSGRINDIREDIKSEKTLKFLLNIPSEEAA